MASAISGVASDNDSRSADSRNESKGRASSSVASDDDRGAAGLTDAVGDWSSSSGSGQEGGGGEETEGEEKHCCEVVVVEGQV